MKKCQQRSSYCLLAFAFCPSTHYHMITFPCSKINLGLNVVGVRPNGYHDIETVFFPIPLCDTLEITRMDEQFPSDNPCDLKITGKAPDVHEDNNLVIQAYRLLAKDFPLPRVHAHLCKKIPSQAGLGGGSSDAAFMIRLLNEQFKLNLTTTEMERHAAQLGADCAFFITAKPSFATGVGDQLVPTELPKRYLDRCHLALIKPDIAVSTKDAYAKIEVKRPAKCCRDIIGQPIETWKDELMNDFEIPVFKLYPKLKHIKEQLYQQGAVYAAMSGSGSTIYGIFKKEPQGISQLFDDCFTTVLHL